MFGAFSKCSRCFEQFWRLAAQFQSTCARGRSYQLLCQTKTLTTAFFFVTLLGRVLTRVQWVALCLLSAGVGLVQSARAASPGRAGVDRKFPAAYST